jgi:hypothetical protein
VHTTEVRVTYQLTTGDRVDVVIGRDKTEESGDLEPLITSSRELTPNNDGEQPTLTLPLDGRIVSISAGGNTCSNPVSAKLQPIGKTSDDRPSKRMFFFAAIAVLAVATAVAYALGFFDFNGNEERPPIIVRGGSIVFENQLVSGTGQSKRWVPSGTKKWKPDHQEGKRINDFEVTFTGVQCATLTGHPVRITRTNGSGATETYDIKREGWLRVDPKVVAPQTVDLVVNNAIPKATLTSPDTGGAITEVRIGGSSCALPAENNAEIIVQPR